EFPSGPVNLQTVTIVSERITFGNSVGNFNKLILNTRKSPVIKVNSIKINYLSGGSYLYNIENLGYQLKNDRYDQNYASKYLTLEDNQIQLSSKVLEDPNFIQPGVNDTIIVSYDYQNLGKIIDSESIDVIKI